MKNSILKFEGAGCSEAEHNGVGNCRIRATFQTPKGPVYLEMTGHESTKYSISRMRLRKFPWHISHIFYLKDEDKSFSPELSPLTHEIMEYTPKNILRFVNECFETKFKKLEVINDGSYSGFDLQ